MSTVMPDSTEITNNETTSSRPNNSLRLHAHVLQTQDANGLKYLEVDNPLCTAKIALQARM